MRATSLISFHRLALFPQSSVIGATIKQMTGLWWSQVETAPHKVAPCTTKCIKSSQALYGAHTHRNLECANLTFNGLICGHSAWFRMVSRISAYNCKRDTLRFDAIMTRHGTMSRRHACRFLAFTHVSPAHKATLSHSASIR